MITVKHFIKNLVDWKSDRVTDVATKFKYNLLNVMAF